MNIEPALLGASASAEKWFYQQCDAEDEARKATSSAACSRAAWAGRKPAWTMTTIRKAIRR
jgi:hypothetical protein